MTADLVEDVEVILAGDDVAGERGRPGASVSPAAASRRGSTASTPNKAAVHGRAPAGEGGEVALAQTRIGGSLTDSPSAREASPPAMTQRRRAKRAVPTEPPSGPIAPYEWRHLFALTHFSFPVTAPQVAEWIQRHIYPEGSDFTALNAYAKSTLERLVKRGLVEPNRRPTPNTFRLIADPLPLFEEAIRHRVLGSWVITAEHARILSELAAEQMRHLAATQHDPALYHVPHFQPPADDDDTKA